MVDSDSDQNRDLAENKQGVGAEWTTTNFERPNQTQIKRTRFTYINGLFKPENGPYLLENAFQKPENATLTDICTEIANILKDDQ